MTSDWAPSEPQATGPMPASSAAPTTTAPAPSPKMNAVERSVGSRKVLSFSTPTTRTYGVLPARTRSDATASPWQKPAQPATRSKDAAVEPSRWAIWGAAAGVCWVCVEVATMIVPTRSAAMPADASASRAARSPMSNSDSPSPAYLRVRMPDRLWIHSSLESRTWQISSLSTTRSGR